MIKRKVTFITKSGREIHATSWVQELVVEGKMVMVAGYKGHAYYSTAKGVYIFK
jgi:hypothetical protein